MKVIVIATVIDSQVITVILIVIVIDNYTQNGNSNKLRYMVKAAPQHIINTSPFMKIYTMMGKTPYLKICCKVR